MRNCMCDWNVLLNVVFPIVVVVITELFANVEYNAAIKPIKILYLLMFIWYYNTEHKRI